MKFKDLGVIEPILKSIKEKNISKPTLIQEKSIPIILEGNDIIAGSKTGSGKTLAFSTAIIQSAEKNKGVQAIVLVPTRELAVQVCESIRHFSKYKGLRANALYGGVSINPQIENIKRSEIIVGTPGRVLDHLSRGTLNLDKIKIAVLDEADRMLDMGFIDDVKNILNECPKNRQTLLYSATISSEIYNLAKDYMDNPKKVSVESNVDPKKLSQNYIQVQQNLKFSLLAHLLKKNTSGLSMVFCNTQRTTENVSKSLNRNGISAISIHGGLSQAKRTKTLEMFHSGKSFVLVCTDVAARGLHINDVSYVYNYDIPKEPKQYIHRVGRTARAGNKGRAISLLAQRDYDNFNNVLREYNLEIEKMETPYVERLAFSNNQKSNYKRGFKKNRRRFRYN